MFGSFGLIIAVAGLATLSAGGLAYAFMFGRIQNEYRIEQRLGLVQGENSGDTGIRARANLDAARRRKGVSQALAELDEKQKARAKQSNSPPLSLRIEQAGLKWTRQRFLVISLICGLVIFVGVWVATHIIWAAAAFAVAGILGLPRWYVNFMRKRRFKRFLNEFANAMDVIVRGVKAGLPLHECIRIIANEAAEPVKGEFRQISEAQALGITLSEAVAKLPERVPVPETSFFSIVVTIQQKAGGNLSEALGNLSRVLRERRKMGGKIKAMAMEAKASAWIIGSLPVIVMGLVYITSPAYITLLFTDPTGNVILAACGVWMSIGIGVMKKMINFDF
jgi:tight adherence protein B